FKLAELSISRVGKYKLVPNDAVQEYVTNLGQSLIPEYLKAIPDSDPAKLNFRFFVVMNKEPNASALPNGILLIHSSMFDVVENEAQLAAVIGHEIAHATQEHTWRQMSYHKNIKMALGIVPRLLQLMVRQTLQILPIWWGVQFVTDIKGLWRIRPTELV